MEKLESAMTTILTWFVPSSTDWLQYARDSVITIVALILILMIVFLLVFWRITRDLQRWTVYAAAAILLLLGAVVVFAHAGWTLLAALLLIVLLMALFMADIAAFGVSSIGGSAMVVPILLAEIGMGTGAGWIATGICTLAVWVLVWMGASGKYFPRYEQRRDAWTFHAPVLTVLYILVAAIGFVWTSQLLSMRTLIP
jgi:hypothetical protein